MQSGRVQRGGTVALAAFFAVMMPGAEKRKEPARLPAQLEPIFGIAMAAPPEFAASALLRLNSQVTDRDLRRDLINMAFLLAAKSQNPVRLIAFPGSEVDTRSGSLARALRLRMDALSLQSTAVQEMVAVDPHRARELFEQINRPAISRATCEDSLLPDVSPYYDALAAVTRGAFSEKERAKGEHLAFARAGLSGASTVAELAPLAHTLASLDWPREYFEIALGSFTSKLEAIGPESRAFLYFSKAIDRAVGALVSHARQIGSSPEALVETYRKFLVTQLKGARCAGSEQIAGSLVGGVDRTALFGDAIRGEQPALSAEEATPEQVEGEIRIERYWQTPGAKKVFEECLLLRQSPTGATLTDAARRTPEWARQLTDFLSTLADWRANEEPSEADYYHEKATVYEALLELAPPGDLGDRVIESYVGFLKSANLQQQNAVEWFWHARSTLNRVRSGHAGQAPKLLAAFRSSGSIVLMLEAMLDQAAPSNPFLDPNIPQ